MQIRLKDGKATWKQEWKVIDGRRIFFRSRWEFRYALYLQLLKEKGEIKDWQHEPKTFWFEGIKRGTNNYKPDFLVIHKNDSEEWVEVKGYMDSKSATKIKRMAKYFPQIKLRVVDKSFFTKNSKNLKILIKDWE
jgi:hypothetical protein